MSIRTQFEEFLPDYVKIKSLNFKAMEIKEESQEAEKSKNTYNNSYLEILIEDQGKLDARKFK